MNVLRRILRSDHDKHLFRADLGRLTFNGDVYLAVVKPLEPTRSLEQNDLAWAIVTAISEQVEIGGRRYDKDVWWLHLKREFFGREMKEMPDGSFIEVEPNSRGRKKQKFSEWIDYLWSQAAEHGVLVEQ